MMVVGARYITYLHQVIAASIDADAYTLSRLSYRHGTILPTFLETEWTTSLRMSLYTDASGKVGWGAYWSGRWLQAKWTPAQSNRNIMWKELYIIVCAVHTWGCLWSRQKVLFHCDNLAVVDIWKKGSTSATDIMALIRLLYFCAARHNIHVIVTHIAGVNNSLADALSCFQVSQFRQLGPQAASQPDNIPAWPAHFLKDSSITTSNLK